MVIVNTNDKEESISTERYSERTNGFTNAVNVITGTAYSSIGSLKLPAKNVVVLELKK